VADEGPLRRLTTAESVRDSRAGDLSVTNQIPAFFDGVPAEDQETVLASLERRRFPAGAIVIAEGDHANELYITQSGWAEVVVSDRHGSEHAVARIRPGSSLGEMSLFTGQPAVGTVRATGDLEVLVMSGREFEQLAERYPRIYRNLGAILSERLARTNRLAVNAAPGGLTIVRDWDAPPLAAYALASSVAWHTRHPTLLLVVSDDPAAELAALDAPTTSSTRRAPRAHVAVVPSLASVRTESLVGRIDDLFHHYGHIVVLVKGEAAVPQLESARTIDLAGAGAAIPERPDGPAVHSIRAWSPVDPESPWRHGVTHLPELTPEDERALQDGLLSNRTPAGGAIGWLARDVAGLKVGVALGAGSLRGYAHLGVLNVLERAGVPIDYICGASVGGAVAGMYACGLDEEERIAGLDGAGAAMFRPTVPLKSFLSTRALAAFINGLGAGKRIEDLHVPLALVCADLISRREVVLRRGEIGLAVVASCSIPGIFPPQPVGPYMLVDGGVMNPVPASVAADMGANTVIAVKLGGATIPTVSEVEATVARSPRPSVFSVIMRSIDIMQSRIAPEASEATTVMITPEMTDVGAKLRKFASGRRYMDDGAAAAHEALPRIAAALPWVRP
jgi:NTE family protein